MNKKEFIKEYLSNFQYSDVEDIEEDDIWEDGNLKLGDELTIMFEERSTGNQTFFDAAIETIPGDSNIPVFLIRENEEYWDIHTTYLDGGQFILKTRKKKNSHKLSDKDIEDIVSDAYPEPTGDLFKVRSEFWETWIHKDPSPEWQGFINLLFQNAAAKNLHDDLLPWFAHAFEAGERSKSREFKKVLGIS